MTAGERVGRSQDVGLHAGTLPRPHAWNNDRYRSGKSARSIAAPHSRQGSFGARIRVDEGHTRGVENDIPARDVGEQITKGGGAVVDLGIETAELHGDPAKVPTNEWNDAERPSSVGL